MNTPIVDFLNTYKGNIRFHMPGHKGNENPFDVTEIDGADVLYNPHGIIAESEKIASAIFESGITAYSVEGSSLGIRASVYLVATYARQNGKNPVVLATRNAHSTFISACALSDVNPEWIVGDDYLTAKITANELDKALDRTHATAFYLTSPDYLGNIADMQGLADVCHRHNAIFIVDNAHGAYLKFLSRHPLDFGADITIDSAHKTLPCLTGTAYVHIGKHAPNFFKDNLNGALSVFASTSPSYLLLASLDKFNGIAHEFKQSLIEYAGEVERIKNNLSKHGFSLVGNEPMKLTIATKGYGYYGFDVAKYLEKKKIVVEFSDRDYLTVMFSPSNSLDDIYALEETLLSLPRKVAIYELPPKPTIGERVISIRKAMFAPSVEVSSTDAIGKVLTGLTLSCPPAVPIAICGERLDENAIYALNYYGISKVKVLK